MSTLHTARKIVNIANSKEESTMSEEQKELEVYDDIMDDDDGDSVTTENETEEEMDEDENVQTLDTLNQSDPIEGPVYNFISALLGNASLPIETYRVKVSLGIDKSFKDSDDEFEQIAEITLSTAQRLAILKANVTQLLSLMNQQSVDFAQVSKIREQYGDKANKDFVDITIEELASSDGNEVDYIDYMQRIIPGAKTLYKEDQQGVVQILSAIIDWSKQKDCIELYDDIMKCGGKIMKQVLWSALKQ